MRSLFLLLLCLFEIVRNKAAKYINICVGIHTHIHILHTYGLPEWLSDKESACQAGDVGLIPGSEDSLEKEMATPVFLPGKSMDKGAWWATVRGIAKGLDMA